MGVVIGAPAPRGGRPRRWRARAIGAIWAGTDVRNRRRTFDGARPGRPNRGMQQVALRLVTLEVVSRVGQVGALVREREVRNDRVGQGHGQAGQLRNEGSTTFTRVRRPSSPSSARWTINPLRLRR